uniref:FAM192A/Fyv6 N-terminal domain-containing protein n=1 Tax=Mycena chlorophos TaxID=658473 RepID=A0ABQ0LB69_MYCCL|nr:predicted protein [Mycena chlorophos]
MDKDPSIPSLNATGIGARFVSQDAIESAKARRDEQWKAAYERIGMPPPPQQVEDTDGRSLAEKLAANKIKKQEEFEERSRLANQFRALEEDEVAFLDQIREKREAAERIRNQEDGVEVQNFKAAVAARASALNNPPTAPIPKPAAAPAAAPKPAVAPTRKKGPLKGVVVKKKAKSTSDPKVEETKADEDEPDSKRRRISEA